MTKNNNVSGAQGKITCANAVEGLSNDEDTEQITHESEHDMIAESSAFEPYLVKITADALNIRKGPGTNYGIAGCIRDKGVYTIVAESAGSGSTKGWGKLNSGAGWISLDFCNKR